MASLTVKQIVADLKRRKWTVTMWKNRITGKWSGLANSKRHDADIATGGHADALKVAERLYKAANEYGL